MNASREKKKMIQIEYENDRPKSFRLRQSTTVLQTRKIIIII